MRIVKSFLLVCCLALVAIRATGVARSYDVAAWQARVNVARERVDVLRKSLQTTSAPAWAGEYYQGDHLGFNLDLVVTRDRYAYIVDSDMGPRGGGSGTVTHVTGGVILQLSQDSDRDKALLWDTLGVTLVPIHWGPRRYLVPEREFAEFASAINHGMEPASPGMFLLRMGDEKKSVQRLDGLPEGIVRFVRKVAVEARIVAVRKLPKLRGKPSSPRDIAEDRYALELDKGLRDGVMPGMELWQSSPDNGFSSVTIESADAHHSHGVLGYVIADQPVPSTKWVFTTGQYPPAPHCRCTNSPSSASSL